MTLNRLTVLCIILICVPVRANLLQNPGFEEGPVGQITNVPIPGWNTWNYSGWHHNDAGAVRGTKAVMLWWTDSGIYQDFAVTSGNTYRFSGYMLHTPGDPLRGGNKSGQFRAEWYNSSNSMLREDTVGVITMSDSTGVWHYYSVDLEAPAGSIKGRFLIRMYASSGDGQVHYDDVSVTAINSPDYNRDYYVDYADFNELSTAWQQVNSQYDLNDDQFIDIQDLRIFAEKWMSWEEPVGAKLITVTASETFQQIEGFGASLTDSSAWLIYEFLNPSERQAVLTDLFDPDEGIGLSYLRQPMGASDFRLQEYSYDDLPAGVSSDYSLQYFSISYDEDYIVPTLQEILSINPNVKIMGSPWSPPKWMKTSGQIGGGSLKANVYSTYADYFVRYIQAYAAHGIPVDAITLQNEPYYEPWTYAGCYMSPADQIKLVKEMGPKFAAASITTKILVWDHNWDNSQYAIDVLNDAAARPYIAGSAWHHYAGDVSAQTTVHNAYPDKDIYFTEGSDGTWNDGGFEGDLIRNGNFIVDTIRNWAKTIVKWNLALDQNNGPKIGGGCDTCYGVVTINQATRQITPRPHYYALGHASKFLRPGALRITSNAAGVNSVAFKNTDGSIVLYVVNSGTTSETLKLQCNSQWAVSSIPSRSIMTFVWDNHPGAQISSWLTTGNGTSLLAEQTAVYFHD